MQKGKSPVLFQSFFETPIGCMIGVSDETGLYLLEFLERKNLQRNIEQLQKGVNCSIIRGTTLPLSLIGQELEAYFSGKLTDFQTPVYYFGSRFQKQVWRELLKVQYGHTCSYVDQASRMGKPTAYRAVANANGCNRFAIRVPCHRIIRSDGSLGGYAAGLARKQWLLDHEKKHQ